MAHSYKDDNTMWQYYIDKLLFYLTCVQINACVQMNKHPILIPENDTVPTTLHYLIYFLKFL